MRRTLIAGAIVIMVAALLGIIVGLSVQQSQQGTDLLVRVAELERESAVQVAEHRVANQFDHDEAEDYHRCMLRFVVTIIDPARDRTMPPELPAGCEGTVAEDEVKKAATPSTEEPK